MGIAVMTFTEAQKWPGISACGFTFDPDAPILGETQVSRRA
jgi:hypothetical protein